MPPHECAPIEFNGGNETNTRLIKTCPLDRAQRNIESGKITAPLQPQRARCETNHRTRSRLAIRDFIDKQKIFLELPVEDAVDAGVRCEWQARFNNRLFGRDSLAESRGTHLKFGTKSSEAARPLTRRSMRKAKGSCREAS